MNEFECLVVKAMKKAIRFLRLFHALKSNWCAASPYSQTKFKLAL